MPRHHRNETRKMPPTALSVSPLEIPEILEHILSYLSRRTLKRVARVVCRQWFLLSRRFIPQRLHSSEQHTTYRQRYDDIHALIQTATTVHWTISTEDFCEGRLMTDELRKKYSSNDRLDATIGRDEDVTESTSVRVQDLTMNALSYHTDCYLWRLGSMLSGLTCLDLSDAATIDLAPLFIQCPNLIRLRLVNQSVNKHGSLSFELPTLPGLRSLTMESCTATPPDLNSLFLALPSLQEARLHLNAPYYHTTYPRAELEPRLLEVLKDRCGELQAIAISYTAQQCCRPEFVQKVIDQVAPNATEWGLDARSMNPATFGRLLQRSTTTRNVVTRLDLRLTNLGERFYPSAAGLYSYLRASPHLLHLIAPDITLASNDVDPFHGILPFPHRKIEPHNLSPRSGLMDAWACRDLQTLKITLLEKYIDADDIFERSRIVFGFLSRTCPKLRELDVSYRSPSLGLESGFCLLSRLKYLERLNITLDHPHHHSSELPAMDWLVTPSARTLHWRLSQAWKLSRLTSAWKVIMRAEKETIDCRRSMVATTSVASNLMAGERCKWEENGALTDVWNVLHQLVGADQKAQSVWPLLSQLCILLNLRSRKAMSDLVHKYRPWVDTSSTA